MSTPPNPPDSPTEPEGTPIPPPSPSLPKPPTPPAPPQETPAPAQTPEAPPAAPAAPKPSLEKAAPETARLSPELARAAAETPGPSPEETPAAAEAPKPSLEKAPATPETAKPSLQKAPPATEADRPSPEGTPSAAVPAPSLEKAPAAEAPAAPGAAPVFGVPAAAAQGFGHAGPPAGGAVAADPWATPVPGAPVPTPAPAGFAPVGPGPAAPGAGAYGAPANAWAAPPPGGHPGYGAPGYGGPGQPGFPGYGAPGYPLTPPAPSNGQAVAGLVLAILAIGIGLIPFVFWVGGCLALTGIGLSIAGLVRANRGAPRKVMSIVGIVLGLLGLAATAGGFLFTMAVVDKFPDRVDQHQGSDWYDDPEYDAPDALPSPSGFTLPPDMPSTGPGISTPVAFGQTVTYPNGIQVSLSTPKRYTSSNKYLPVGNAVEVSFTITNTSKRPHDVIYAMPNLADDKGAEGKLVFDGRLPKRIQGTIQPGESATGTAAFEVPEGTRSVSAALSPGLLMPDAKFTGPVG
ncbi:DUF4190 domain-containing protein [Streptomyces lavendulae]|uniref:DUF4190 domain-containing protein n=1 Tax=Streptomyces lavendulae TaxID=1914 RepID=UPI0031EE5FCD